MPTPTSGLSHARGPPRCSPSQAPSAATMKPMP
jgi:hypothetical protein